MTLKTMLKHLCEVRYNIKAHTPDDNWEYLEIDYLGDRDQFAKALAIRERWEKAKNKVTFVRYNTATKCIEIDIDLL